MRTKQGYRRKAAHSVSYFLLFDVFISNVYIFQLFIIMSGLISNENSYIRIKTLVHTERKSKIPF